MVVHLLAHVEHVRHGGALSGVLEAVGGHGVSVLPSLVEAPGLVLSRRAVIDRFVALALDCVHREFPNQVRHLMSSAADAECRPRELTPCFYGCFDWHSAVHSHWVLAVAVQRESPLADRALAALQQSLAPENVAAEARYLDGRPGFERPYGLAWLAQLWAQLLGHETTAPLGEALTPLVDVAQRHIDGWLPKLSHPVRSGTHNQTAFGLGLWLDAVRATGRADALYTQRARDFYANDHDYPLHLEPSGEDFLSPALGPADLLARVLAPAELAAWLDRAMPELDAASFTPVTVTDPTDGRLAHLDGLNLSRAWMLHRLARALPEDDARRPTLAAAAEAHAERGLAAVGAEHYEGAHWLGTFATYLVRVRGN